MYTPAKVFVHDALVKIAFGLEMEMEEKKEI